MFPQDRVRSINMVQFPILKEIPPPKDNKADDTYLRERNMLRG